MNAIQSFFRLKPIKTWPFLIVVIFCNILTFGGQILSAAEINVMAPLLVGDPNNIHLSQNEWNDFRNQLKQLKQAGVQAISTDIWWGIIESEGPGKFNWHYYDELASSIRAAGLHWIPILSFHQLGGNVGDVGFTPIPEWIWSAYKKDSKRFQESSDMMFRSEQGHVSKEYVSVWSTDLVVEDYRRVMNEFKLHFAPYGNIVDEINISLGPSGELRYPSYNSHDVNTDYPTRGALQAYSRPAIISFQEAMKKKYQTLERLNQAWGFSLTAFSDIFPPNPELLKGAFWKNKEEFSPYGQDFFIWYNQSLIKHGSKMLSLAESVFASADSAFKKSALGGKMPGIHWRLASDRLAELAAGLIRSSYGDWYSEKSGFGYRDTLTTFKAKKNKMKRVLHFTALEMDDYRDGAQAQSRAKTLVKRVAKAALQLGLEVKGENALAGELSNVRSWDNIFEALMNDGYSGITLLRSNEILNDPTRTHYLSEFAQRLRHSSTKKCSALFN